MRATKKFDLVFDVPIKKNSFSRKKIQLNDIFKVLQIDGENITCAKYPKFEEIFAFNSAELVSVAIWGAPIYPCLQKLDEVCNAPDSDLWHVLMESDNYHALQLLQYTCAEKVDCIYIDSPYNTGARDLKYNRHSKCLVINPNGVARDHEMYRVEEYAFFIYFGNVEPAMLDDTFFTSEVRRLQAEWQKLGVARYVTWVGNYLGSEIPMADGCGKCPVLNAEENLPC